MSTPAITPFRAGGTPPPGAGLPAVTGSVVYLADISEYQMDLADAAYLAWSEAVIFRALYGTRTDDAWYGGARRAALHAGGAKFIGIYAYLVAGEPGATQAQALHALVGDLQPGEVLIADFEEGAKAELTAWYNEMLALYGLALNPFMWTYSGLYFGQEQGLGAWQWLADYASAEPGAPVHLLWQFTSDWAIPGIDGPSDCSLFHGTIDQLAALAYQTPKPAPDPKPAPAPAAKDTAMIIISVTAPETDGSWEAGKTRTFTYAGPSATPPQWIQSAEDQASLAEVLPTRPISWAQYKEFGGV